MIVAFAPGVVGDNSIQGNGTPCPLPQVGTEDLPFNLQPKPGANRLQRHALA